MNENKIIFGLTIIVAMLFIIMIYKPEQAYATQSGTDEFHAVDCSDYGSATYCEVYYLYCFTFWEDYVGYVEIYYSCDEWGNLSSWIKYNPVNSNQ